MGARPLQWLRLGAGLVLAALLLGTGVACEAGGAGSGGTSGGGTGGVVEGGSTASAGGGDCDPGSTTVDDDFDGFTEDQGDCNDCDPAINPNAMELIVEGEAADDDCDGLVDEPFEPCDQDLAIDSLDPYDAARAIDICQVAGEGADWGLLSAEYVNADGTPVVPSFNVGLLPKFGDHVVPRGGSAMLGLSTGHARDASQPDSCGSSACSIKPIGVVPPGFPQPVPGCATATPDQIRNDVAFEFQLRAPSNAHRLAFDFAFFTFEFPGYVCTGYNDQFVAIMTPPPNDSIMGNISFDEQSNPVSVNLAMFDHCDPNSIDSYALSCQGPCPLPPRPYCPDGPQLLIGTGFDQWGDPTTAGSTGWLSSSAPVNPGATVELRFAVWDAGDYALDSTVALDNVRWLHGDGATATIPLLE